MGALSFHTFVIALANINQLCSQTRCKLLDLDNFMKTTFGCRMMALCNMPSASQQELLNKADRSLKRVTVTGEPQPKDGFNGILPSEVFYSLVRHPEIGANNNGWGAVSLDANRQVNKKNILPAHQDVSFDETVQLLNGQDSFWHVRAATVGSHHKESGLRNTHPYVYGAYTFMHNGTLKEPAFSKDVTHAIRKALPDVTLYEDDSDSRRLFFAILAGIKQDYGTLDNTKLSKQQLTKSFATTLNNLTRQAPVKYVSINDDYSQLPVTGSINWTGRNAFIFSAGNLTLATRHGRPLYLSFKTTADNKMSEAALVFEPPKASGRVWYELPDDHVLSLENKKDGTINAELTPIEQVASSEPNVITTLMTQLHKTVAQLTAALGHSKQPS